MASRSARFPFSRHLFLITSSLGIVVAQSCAHGTAEERVQQKREALVQAEAKSQREIAELRDREERVTTFIENRIDQQVADEKSRVEKARQELADSERLLAAQQAAEKALTAADKQPDAAPPVVVRDDKGRLVVTGTLIVATDKEVFVRETTGNGASLQTTDATLVKAGGKHVNLAQCKKGTPLKALVKDVQGDKVAHEIEVLSISMCDLKPTASR